MDAAGAEDGLLEGWDLGAFGANFILIELVNKVKWILKRGGVIAFEKEGTTRVNYILSI